VNFPAEMVSISYVSAIFPTHLLLIQALAYDLFVKSTVHTNLVFINPNLHYLLWGGNFQLKGNLL
jgi:hypothetical protein